MSPGCPGGPSELTSPQTCFGGGANVPGFMAVGSHVRGAVTASHPCPPGPCPLVSKGLERTRQTQTFRVLSETFSPGRISSCTGLGQDHFAGQASQEGKRGPGGGVHELIGTAGGGQHTPGGLAFPQQVRIFWGLPDRQFFSSPPLARKVVKCSLLWSIGQDF